MKCPQVNVRRNNVKAVPPIFIVASSTVRHVMVWP
jgi:hypothetical protein